MLFYCLLWSLVWHGCIATHDAHALSLGERTSVLIEAEIILDKHPKYVFGGHESEERGLDCSGFVYLVYRRAGLNVGRTTSRKMRLGLSGWDGVELDDEPFQVGDLVFWTWRGRPDRPDGHVGIIIRIGILEEVAHASARRGVVQDPVQGSLLDDISARVSIRNK